MVTACIRVTRDTTTPIVVRGRRLTMLHCDSCNRAVHTVTREDQQVCVVCQRILGAARGAGALVPSSCTRDRPGSRPKSAVRRAIQRSTAANDAEREAATRAAQAAVEAICGGGRAGAGAARAVADRAARNVLAQRTEVDLPEGADLTEACLRRAEEHLLRYGARSAGKAVCGGAMLHRARDRRGACVASTTVPEDVWCLCAVAIAVCDEYPAIGDEARLLDAARAMTERYMLLPKGVCSAAIVELWKYGG